MKSTLNYIFKFATCIATLIALEGLLTLGWAFKFEKYDIAAWIFQGCLVIICAKIASYDWEDK